MRYVGGKESELTGGKGSFSNTSASKKGKGFGNIRWKGGRPGRKDLLGEEKSSD